MDFIDNKEYKHPCSRWQKCAGTYVNFNETCGRERICTTSSCCYTAYARDGVMYMRSMNLDEESRPAY